MSEIILFPAEKPAFYLLSQIFDSVTNPTGTIIPRPGSIVLDFTSKILKTVESVRETSPFNSTYSPVVTVLSEPKIEEGEQIDENILSIIDYGNSLFYLFFDEAETPTKLNIDVKVKVFYSDAASYEITKWDPVSNQYVPISLYYDTNGTFSGTKIPLATVSGTTDHKILTNCHTSHQMEDGGVYHLNIYDYAGTQRGSFKLYAKRAIINNVIDDTLLIEDFIVESTQQELDGSFYLFPDQDPNSLVITPRLIYSNGTNKAIAIDNSICHLYGFEGFTSAYSGQEIYIMVKYFLAPSQQAVTDTLVTTAISRSLVRQIKVRVKDPGDNDYNVKILAVPVYIQSVNRWVLMFYLYTLGDNTVRNVTTSVSLSPAFDGLLMGVDQPLSMTLRLREIFPDIETDYIYQQPIVIRVAPFSYYERYILRDSVGDSYGVFGVDSPILSRPVLYFDENQLKYFVPTTKFNNKNSFLEAFYYKMRPIYDSASLSEPVVPTHFTLRNAMNGGLLLSTPIDINSYGQGFSLVNVENQNALLGTNCIVEFLRYEQSQYKVLFGSPVDVYQGTFA